MFPESEWNEKEMTASCEATYGMTPQYDWTFTYFGGKNPKKDFQFLLFSKPLLSTLSEN